MYIVKTWNISRYKVIISCYNMIVSCYKNKLSRYNISLLLKHEIYDILTW